MLKSKYSSYTQLLFPCHMCVNIHELRHMVDIWSHLFVYSLGKIINNIKSLSWSLGKYEPVLIHRKMAGWLGGRWLTGLWVILPWTPLFTVKALFYGEGEGKQKIPGVQSWQSLCLELWCVKRSDLQEQWTWWPMYLI